MASLGFNLGFTFSSAQIQQHRKVSGGGRVRVISCNSSSSSSSSQASSPQGISAATPPEIELEFFGVTIGAIFSLSSVTIRFKTQKEIFLCFFFAAEAGERRVVSGG